MTNERKQLRAERLAEFDAIVESHQGPLLRYVARILNDKHAAQDVVQDVFIALCRRWPEGLEPTARLSAWLYRVAHNRAVDSLRKQARRDGLHRRGAEGRDEIVPPDRGEAFRISEAAEQAAAALRTLSLREQQLVVLKVYEEKSYREIGEITGLSVGNVGFILHHAMRKMAAELKRAKAI